MGLPLLLVGTSAGRFLPKSGEWMESIKKIFGILMLAVAIWMLSRVMNASMNLILWGALFIVSALWMHVLLPFKNIFSHLRKIVSAILLAYGLIVITGAAMGGTDLFHPWEFSSTKKSSFIVVKNMLQFDNELMRAKKLVLLDFYADWCTACVEMDKAVFSRSDVQDALKNVVLLRDDMTAYNEFDRALMQRYQVIAPPTILFFTQGKEISSAKIVGEISAEKFILRIPGHP